MSVWLLVQKGQNTNVHNFVFYFFEKGHVFKKWHVRVQVTLHSPISGQDWQNYPLHLFLGGVATMHEMCLFGLVVFLVLGIDDIYKLIWKNEGVRG